MKYDSRVSLNDNDMENIKRLIDVYEKVYNVRLSQRKAVMNAVATLTARLEAEVEDES